MREVRAADEICALRGDGKETEFVEDVEGAHRTGVIIARKATRAGGIATCKDTPDLVRSSVLAASPVV